MDGCKLGLSLVIELRSKVRKFGAAYRRMPYLQNRGVWKEERKFQSGNKNPAQTKYARKISIWCGARTELLSAAIHPTSRRPKEANFCAISRYYDICSSRLSKISETQKLQLPKSDSFR